MPEQNLTLVHERLAKLEVSGSHRSKKIDEIHKALIGNGQPGIIAEWNQWKGGVRFFGYIVGICIAILGISVSVLACIK